MRVAARLKVWVHACQNPENIYLLWTNISPQILGHKILYLWPWSHRANIEYDIWIQLQHTVNLILKSRSWVREGEWVGLHFFEEKKASQKKIHCFVNNLPLLLGQTWEQFKIFWHPSNKSRHILWAALKVYFHPLSSVDPTGLPFCVHLYFIVCFFTQSNTTA